MRTWHGGVLCWLVCGVHGCGHAVAAHLHHGRLVHAAGEHGLLAAHRAHHCAGLRQALGRRGCARVSGG